MVLDWLYGFADSPYTPASNSYLAQLPLGELPVTKYVSCAEGELGPPRSGRGGVVKLHAVHVTCRVHAVASVRVLLCCVLLCQTATSRLSQPGDRHAWHLMAAPYWCSLLYQNMCYKGLHVQPLVISTHTVWKTNIAFVINTRLSLGLNIGGMDKM